MSFTLSAQPNTDIWKKPPSHDVFSAPFRPHATAPLTLFRSARLTFTSTYTLQFDQAGLLLTFTKPAAPSTPRKWIKAGVEFFSARPRLSTVCCDAWADWSVAPLARAEDEDAVKGGEKAVTVLVEKLVDETGVGLWVYAVGEDGERTPMREIAWVYADEGGEGWELEVSALVARPSKEGSEALEARFVDFDVRWDEA